MMMEVRTMVIWGEVNDRVPSLETWGSSFLSFYEKGLIIL